MEKMNADQVIEWVESVMGVYLTLEQRGLIRGWLSDPLARAQPSGKFAEMLIEAYHEEQDRLGPVGVGCYPPVEDKREQWLETDPDRACAGRGCTGCEDTRRQPQKLSEGNDG